MEAKVYADDVDGHSPVRTRWHRKRARTEKRALAESIANDISSVKPANPYVCQTTVNRCAFGDTRLARDGDTMVVET